MSAEPRTTSRPSSGAERTPSVEDRTASPGSVLLDVLRDRRRSLVGWSIALAVVSTIYVSFYPLIGAEQMLDMANMIPEEIAAAIGYDQLGDAAGYISATVFGILGPALLLVFAIGAGARLVAGNEEEGTLELEFTHPVARRTVYVERLGGLWLSAAILATVTGMVSWLWIVALDMEVSTVGVLAGTVGLLLLAVAFGTVAFAVGAATGRRAVGLAAAAGLAVAAYMADAIGPLVGADWITTVSPWSWYLGNDPLREGFDPLGFGLLAALILVAATAGAVRMERRDLGV
jgi:ABC-2 type transport system permease protein